MFRVCDLQIYNILLSVKFVSLFNLNPSESVNHEMSFMPSVVKPILALMFENGETAFKISDISSGGKRLILPLPSF